MAGLRPMGVKLAGLRGDCRLTVMVREGAPSTPCGAGFGKGWMPTFVGMTRQNAAVGALF
jgi:hypothetical protein